MSKAVLPESNLRVLEDGDDALLEAEQPGEAEIVGEGDDLGEEFVSMEELQKEDKPAPVVVKPAAVKPAAAAAAEDEIPAEFRGKTPKELVKMYQEAHSTIGRQGTELGEYRRKADQVIQASLRVLEAQRNGERPTAADVAAAQKPLPDESAIFAKPIESINALVENHPAILAIRKTLGTAAASEATRRAEQAGERFNQAHPDSQEILRDPEFRQWVGASPIRRDLLLRANNNYDFAAGDEVFSTWKALKGRAQPAAKTQAEQPAVAAAAAASGAPSEAEVKAAAQTMARARTAKTQAAAAQAAAAPTGGASAAPSKGGQKLYRRADVVRLMVEDPDRYEALAPELTIAYREGRVR